MKLCAVLVVAEGVAPRLAKVGLQTADGEVHVRHLPCVGVELLTVDGHIAQVALVLLHKLRTLYEHST